MRAITFKISIIFLLFFTTTAFESAYAPTSAGVPDICDTDNVTFQDGEKLTYKLYYNWGYLWLSAGELTFTVKDLGSEYYVSAYGQTYKSYEWFFKVRDHYEAYIDKETLLPRKAIRNVAEGKYRLFDELTYNQSAQTVSSKRGKTKDKTKTVSYDVDACMHDILSILYYLRNLDQNEMKTGDKVDIRIFMDKEVWPLKLTYKGKSPNKRIKELGKFNTVVVSPEVISGEVFEEGTEMNIYVSDDNNRVPLLIESPVSVGSVKAILKNHSGLKYDLTSKK